jgi:ferrous iron transport protein B
MGLIAKESVVGTFGVLYGFGEVAEDGSEVWSNLAASFTMLSGYAFLVFNLLCAPCFAAIGAIRREMNSAKWFWFAIGYQTCFAYVVALLVYQVGHLITTGNFSLGNVIVGIIVLAAIVLAIIKVVRDKKKGKCAGCDLCDGLENRKCS